MPMFVTRSAERSVLAEERRVLHVDGQSGGRQNDAGHAVNAVAVGEVADAQDFARARRFRNRPGEDGRHGRFDVRIVEEPHADLVVLPHEGGDRVQRLVDDDDVRADAAVHSHHEGDATGALGADAGDIGVHAGARVLGALEHDANALDIVGAAEHVAVAGLGGAGVDDAESGATENQGSLALLALVVPIVHFAQDLSFDGLVGRRPGEDGLSDGLDMHVVGDPHAHLVAFLQHRGDGVHSLVDGAEIGADAAVETDDERDAADLLVGAERRRVVGTRNNHAATLGDVGAGQDGNGGGGGDAGGSNSVGHLVFPNGLPVT